MTWRQAEEIIKILLQIDDIINWGIVIMCICTVLIVGAIGSYSK